MTEFQKNAYERKLAAKVSTVGIVVNVLLSIFKFAAGIIANSAAMISDAIHSASDVFATIIALLGVCIARRSSDNSHRYGHERYESIASMLLAIILAVTAFKIGSSAVENIISGNQAGIPGTLALIAAIVSIVTKELLYQYTMIAAKKINSGAMKANAWHHRSDAYSSIGALFGIILSRAGFAAGDAIASIIICFFIGKVAYDIMRDSVDKLVDKSCDESTIEQIRDTISARNGVVSVDDIRARLFGEGMYVDIEISADGQINLDASHQIAEDVHLAVEQAFPAVKDCTVHVNPYDGEICTTD